MIIALSDGRQSDCFYAIQSGTSRYICWHLLEPKPIPSLCISPLHFISEIKRQDFSYFFLWFSVSDSLSPSVVLLSENQPLVIDWYYIELVVVSAPLSLGTVAAQVYNTDCISVLNRRCRNNWSFLFGSRGMFRAICGTQKDKLCALPPV